MLMKAVRQPKTIEMVSFEYKGQIHSLPKQPSDLIRWALRDMWKGFGAGQFKINMNLWLTPYSTGVCTGCFAGAALWGIVGSVAVGTVDLYRMPDLFSCRIFALNCFRMGQVRSALETLDLLSTLTEAQIEKLESNAGCYLVSVILTRQNLIHFSRTMLATARQLEEIGL